MGTPPAPAQTPAFSFFARRDSPVSGPGALLNPRQAPPSSITIGDFDSDGRPDVAVLSESTSSLVLMTNTGGGAFRSGKAINVGATPTALVHGDFNGDGKLDVAVISRNGLAILFGNGNGTFQPLANIADASGNALAVADFNGDGKLDLVAGDSGSDQLRLLLGNGNGTFQPIVLVPAGGNPASLLSGDLNGDGKADILVATGHAGQIATLLGHGNGTFEPPELAPLPGATALAIGDFNEDGNLDVACGATLSGQSAVALLLGDGAGHLGNPVSVVSEGTGPAVITAADLDHDGHLDLIAVLTDLAGNKTLVLRGNGDGTFQPPDAYSMGGPTALGVGDFDGDHRLDIVTGNANINLSLLSVLLGQGDGTFQVPPQTGFLGTPAGVTPASMRSGDLNADGLTDFIVAESTGAQVLLGAGNGQLTRGQFINVKSDAIALGDVNRDGIPDVVMTTRVNNVQVMLGNGDGTFQAALNSNALAPQGAVAIGDFTNDGKPDLALVLKDHLSVMAGKGDGTFAAPTAIFELGSHPIYLTTGDFNKDGKLDVVVTNIGIPSGPASISVLLGNGDGTFQPQFTLPLPTDAAPWDVKVADLNRDGNPDIVSSNNNELYASIYLGNGDGTFQDVKAAFTAYAPLNLVILDFNGDGIPDIAFASQGEEDVGVMIGKGDGTFAPTLFFGANDTPKLIGAGTIAADELPGLVLINLGFSQRPPLAYTVLRNTTR